MNADQLLEELRAIWERAPVPREHWHAWVEVIARLHEDVEIGLAVLEADEAARHVLVAVVEDRRPDVADNTGHDAVGAAIARLADLPRPDGKHPFLEHILPALEVAEVVLGAVASSPEARRRFDELAQRVPASSPTGS